MVVRKAKERILCTDHPHSQTRVSPFVFAGSGILGKYKKNMIESPSSASHLRGISLWRFLGVSPVLDYFCICQETLITSNIRMKEEK